MGLNFRKSLSIGKLFRLNFSKRGVGISAGVKGARISLNKQGVRETVSLPGTGLSWSERQSFKKRASSGAPTAGAEADPMAGASAAATKKRKGNLRSLLWVALVAGAFLLYRSGALDPVLARIGEVFTGKGTTLSASATPGVSAVSSSIGASAVASDVATATPAVAGKPAATGKDSATESNASGSGSSSNAASGTGVLQMKDGKVTLSADTLFVASKTGTKFHKPDCRTVGSMSVKNLVQYATREQAAAAKDPCSICNP